MHPVALPAPPLRFVRPAIVLLWFVFYATWTLWTPPLLDDADSVHAEVAREMLVRRDPVTLYANGIRYLEKAPLLYWSMAACQATAAALGGSSPRVLAAASRVPLALAVLALALLCEAMVRWMLSPPWAGLWAGLSVLSSFGVFIFTRITIPDVMVCLWTTSALGCFWQLEWLDRTVRSPEERRREPWWCAGFAASCALNVLTKGLIGVVFPVAIVALHLLLTRSWRGALERMRRMANWRWLLLFFAIAAPWHIAAGIANPTQGQPAAFRFVLGHWQVPLPTDGNVRGWFWFYFMNEHVLRYLNLRVPRDYDTAPLWLFWGLCFVWLMPWSAFMFKAVAAAVPLRSEKWRSQRRRHDLSLRQTGSILLIVWAAFVLLFFSLSTRQEYYVLPAFPALLMLVALWLGRCSFYAPDPPESRVAKEHQRSSPRNTAALSHRERCRRAYLRCTGTLSVLGGLFAVASLLFLLKTKAPTPATDLASLLAQNPGDYALSMGHFLDLNSPALGLFRLPLLLAALSLFGGPLAAFLLRKQKHDFSANGALVAGAFGFLLAAHLGLQIFAPVIGSAQLAEAIRPEVRPNDLIAIHGEYEAGSTLGFYLKRSDIHILEGRSSNLWYGSFFPDAPKIFETPDSFAAKWAGPQRVFLWQSLTEEPKVLPPLPGPVYVVAKAGGKEIVSNRPNR